MIPKHYELFFPVLELLGEKNHKRKTATNELTEKLNLSTEDRNQLTNSGLNLFENRVGWAFTFLTKAEYIELSEERATYKITDLGRIALKDIRESKKTLDENYLIEHSPNYLKNWNVEKVSSAQQNIEEDNLTASRINLEEEWQKNQDEFDLELIEKIREMSWQNFEDFCANLMEKMNYGVAAKRTIRVRDGGIDGEILEDELGLKGKIYIQAKKWQAGSKVGSKDMKEFLYNIKGKKGVFITTSDFSEDAKSEVVNFKDGFVALINYKDLIKLCKKYQHHCKRKLIEIYELR